MGASVMPRSSAGHSCRDPPRVAAGSSKPPSRHSDASLSPVPNAPRFTQNRSTSGQPNPPVASLKTSHHFGRDLPTPLLQSFQYGTCTTRASNPHQSLSSPEPLPTRRGRRRPKHVCRPTRYAPPKHKCFSGLRLFGEADAPRKSTAHSSQTRRAVAPERECSPFALARRVSSTLDRIRAETGRFAHKGPRRARWQTRPSAP